MLLEPLVSPFHAALLPERDDKDHHNDEVLSADGEALSIRAALDAVTVEMASMADRFSREQGWTRLAFARCDDYARERLDRTGRWLREMAALGAALRTLPGLSRAMLGTDGARPLGRVSAMLVARVATTRTLAVWLAVARVASVRKLRARVRRALTQEDPCDEVVTPERHLVVLPVPPEVKAAFEETLDLFRAVEGGEASVASFVEALCAEGETETARPDPHGTGECRPLRHVRHRDGKEEGLGTSTRLWSHLPEMGAVMGEVRAAGDIETRLRALVAIEDRLERRLAGVLRAMSQGRAWWRLRFASRDHYVEERLGLSRRSVRRRAQAARGLERWPALREAYASGDIGLEAALHLCRLAESGWDADSQRLWLARATEATVKRLRDEERAGPSRPGSSRPGSSPPMSDAEWHASLHREPGRSRERVLALGHRATARPVATVFLRLRLPEETAHRFLGAIGGHWTGLQALLEGFVRIWDDPQGMPLRKGDDVYVRDGWRCMAPGCTSRRNLEAHHVTYRSRGGGDGAENLVCLCRFHHQRGEHGGLAACRGRAPLGLLWRMGRGQWYRNERRIRNTEGAPKSALVNIKQSGYRGRLESAAADAEPGVAAADALVGRIGGLNDAAI